MEKKAGDIGIIICLIILMLYTQLKLDAWWEWLITQTSHIKKGIHTLKNQYFSSQNSNQTAL